MSSIATPVFVAPVDERRGRPSASSMEMYFACPGSFQLSQQVPPEEDPGSEDADRGTRIHEARAAGDVSLLAFDEADIVEKMAVAEERIYHNWCDDHQIRDAEIFQEKRLWLMNGNQYVFSAKADFFAVSQSRNMALVLDRKSGRLGVTPPVRNWQLRSAVVVLAANYGIVGARVGIVQPYAQTQPLADYSPADIYDKGGASMELKAQLAEIEKPGAPRRAGLHCKHCPAKHICPEAQEKSVAPGVLALTGLRWSTLGPERKLELWNACKMAEPILQAIQANIKADLARDPQAIPGLKKRKDTQVREVTDAVGVYTTLRAQFPQMPVEELNAKFNELCEVSVGAVQKLRREIFGGTAKAAEEWFNQAMAGRFQLLTRNGAVVAEKEEAGG